MGPVTGGHEAVERLAHDGYARLVRAVTLSCGSLPLAEDAVQEALAKAWDRACRGYRFDHLEAWVVTVALNHARRAAVRDRRPEALAPVGSVVPGHVEDWLLDLHAAVDGLPDRQREVVVLHYFLGYGVGLTASTLGIAEGSVKNALFKARASLAQALGITEEMAE